MKTLRFKYVLISILAMLMAFSVVLGLTGIKKTVMAEDSGFSMDVGAYVKLSDEGGLRFRVKMSAEKKNEIVNDSETTLFFLVIPKPFYDKLDGNTDYLSLYNENPALTKCWLVDVDKVHKIYLGEDNAYYANCLINVHEDDLALNFVVIAGTKKGNVVKYADFEESQNTNSLYQTVNNAALDGFIEGVSEVYTDWYGTDDYPVKVNSNEQYEALLEILDSIDGFNVKVDTEKVTEYDAADFEGTDVVVTEEEKVIEISTADEFYEFISNIKCPNETPVYTEKSVILLTDDIDAADYTGGQLPSFSDQSGSFNREFYGTFDGQGHTITGFNCVIGNGSSLFGNLGKLSPTGTDDVYSGHIKNVIVKGVNVTDSASAYCYLLCGNVCNASTIENVYVEGTSANTCGIGRMRSANAKLSNVVVNVTYSGANGYAFSDSSKDLAIIENCYAITNKSFGGGNYASKPTFATASAFMNAETPFGANSSFEKKLDGLYFGDIKVIDCACEMAISLDSSELIMKKEGTETVTASVTALGSKVTEGVTYEFSTEDTSIITITPSADSVNVYGVATGTASVKVVAKYNNEKVDETTISVKVIDLQFSVSAKASTQAGTPNPVTSEKLTVTTSGDAGLGVTITSNNDNVRIINGNVIAANLGDAELTATVNGTTFASSPISVSVKAIPLTDFMDSVEFRRNGDNVLNIAQGTYADEIEAFFNLGANRFGHINMAMVNADDTSKSATFSFTEDGIVIDSAAVRGNYIIKGNASGEFLYEDLSTRTSGTNGVKYVFNVGTAGVKVHVVDYLIKDKTDFDNMNTIAKANGGNDGYFMLANDFDYGKENTFGSQQVTGTFTGTLDGDGHFINHLRVFTSNGNGWFGGIFSTLGGTIRRIAFVNAYVCPNGDRAGYQSGFLASSATDSALVEDVMISAKTLNNSTHSSNSGDPISLTFGGGCTAAYTMKRVVAIVEDFAETNWGTTAYINGIQISANATYENCYDMGFKQSGTHQGITKKNVINNANVHCLLAVRSNDNTLLGDIVRSTIGDPVFQSAKAGCWDTWQGGTGSDGYSRVYLCFKGCMSYCNWSKYGGPKGANAD